MALPRPWLPDSALNDGRLHSAVSEIVGAWADEWFVDTPDFDVCQREEAPFDCDRQISGCSVELDGDGKFDLGMVLLGEVPKGQTLTSADEAVLSELQHLALKSLKMSFAAMGLAGNEPYHEPDKPLLMFLVSLPEIRSKIQIVLESSLAIALRKSLLPSVPTRRTVGSLSAAAGFQSARVGAWLGETKLSVFDISNLEAGDIVVFGKQLGTPLPMVVENHLVEEAFCEVLQEGGMASLKFSAEKMGV